MTWADPAYLDWFAEDLAELRKQVDVLIASCHWGLREEVLTYMEQIARTAIDAGADVVMGHGPHKALPVGMYKRKPIFYGLGSFCFHTGHLGIKHGDWLGLVARLDTAAARDPAVSFTLVRHDDMNETLPVSASDEPPAIEALKAASLRHGALLSLKGDAVTVSDAKAGA